MWSVRLSQSHSGVKCSLRINLIYVLVMWPRGLISLWTSWQADKDHKLQIGKERGLQGSCKTGCVCLYTCVCVCVRIGLMRTPTSSPLGRLTEPLTPLAHQAADPSGWEILSERRQWEAHLPSSTGPVWVGWDGGVCVCACVRGCVCFRLMLFFRPSGLQIIVNVPAGIFFFFTGEEVGNAKSQRLDE